MLLSAVSIGLAALSAAQGLPKKEAVVWESAKNSVAILLHAGIPGGEAALIDKSGLFLANQSTVSTPTVRARLANGKIITLDWKSTDVPTQTVLLQAEDWSAEDGTVVTLHAADESQDRLPVIIVLPSGPVRGELILNNRVGVLSSSRRAFKLSEVRFEASAESVAGALVFDQSGRLIGLLNATLENPEVTAQGTRIAKVAGPKSGPLQVFSGGFNQGQSSFGAKSTIGPADLTTGFTVGPEVLRRVVAGFLSTSHKVQHPAIGITCKDGLTPGALILTVKPDSPAEKIGLMTGDLIVRMDDKPIKTQLDFSLAMESKEVGDSLTIMVTRDGVAHTFKVNVGTIQKAITAPVNGLANSGF